jgi:hypothetical protein
MRSLVFTVLFSNCQTDALSAKNSLTTFDEGLNALHHILATEDAVLDFWYVVDRISFGRSIYFSAACFVTWIPSGAFLAIFCASFMARSIWTPGSTTSCTSQSRERAQHRTRRKGIGDTSRHPSLSASGIGSERRREAQFLALPPSGKTYYSKLVTTISPASIISIPIV